MILNEAYRLFCVLARKIIRTFERENVIQLRKIDGGLQRNLTGVLNNKLHACITLFIILRINNFYLSTYKYWTVCGILLFPVVQNVLTFCFPNLLLYITLLAARAVRTEARAYANSVEYDSLENENSTDLNASVHTKMLW